MKHKIFALITAQESCKRIIDVAKEYAGRLSAEVEVLTVQPLKADAKQRSRDMVCLTGLARETECDIRIVYSDHPLSAICNELEKQTPLHIFVGQGGEKSSFLNRLRMGLVGAPISVVGRGGIIFSLPPLLEDPVASEQMK